MQLHALVCVGEEYGPVEAGRVSLLVGVGVCSLPSGEFRKGKTISILFGMCFWLLPLYPHRNGCFGCCSDVCCTLVLGVIVCFEGWLRCSSVNFRVRFMFATEFVKICPIWTAFQFKFSPFSAASLCTDFNLIQCS
ncbi:hypothetical protein BRADI_4g27148v3 [Brachypodium distachyon]|uniref:Uncharacterized protein n=1 Tax=Brachypodium distachyon TaxID=15368 RepID=A0A0Q3H8M4_BRADI|nr:hypothetical protein BRADI_4g27148v3 [Brachypodium distachyon]